MLGLLIGAGAGALLGFIQFAIGEKLGGRGSFVMFVPSGPYAVGLAGSILMALVGGVLGLITGALGFGPIQGAGLGVLIFVLLKFRKYVLGHRDDPGSMLLNILLVLDLAIIGAFVAVSLRYLFAGQIMLF